MRRRAAGLLLLSAVASVIAGCTESVLIRSAPSDASVFVEGKPVGTTPVVFQTQNVRPLPFRVEKAGLPPVEGTLSTRVAPGRVVGAVFTLGILALYQPMQYFSPNPVDVTLGTEAPAVALIRLYDVKKAVVFEGECVPHDSSCWIVLTSGERCTGEYVREGQGATNKAATVLRCVENIIDCSLIADSSGQRGYGECADTKGRQYRLTLVPKTDEP